MKKKKNYRLLSFFGFLIFFFTFNSILSFAYCLTSPIIIEDQANDIIRSDLSGKTHGIIRDDIDIIKVNVTGQYMNVLFLGNLSSWSSEPMSGSDAVLNVYFTSSSFDPFLGYPAYPYYELCCFNTSITIAIYLLLWTGLNASEEKFGWNGSSWVKGSFGASIGGLIDNNTIMAYIPELAYEIPDNIIVTAISSLYASDFSYDLLDIATNYSADNNGPSSIIGIPGYNWIFIVSIFLCITILSAKSRRIFRKIK